MFASLSFVSTDVLITTKASIALNLRKDFRNNISPKVHLEASTLLIQKPYKEIFIWSSAPTLYVQHLFSEEQMLTVEELYAFCVKLLFVGYAERNTNLLKLKDSLNSELIYALPAESTMGRDVEFAPKCSFQTLHKTIYQSQKNAKFSAIIADTHFVIIALRNLIHNAKECAIILNKIEIIVNKI